MNFIEELYPNINRRLNLIYLHGDIDDELTSEIIKSLFYFVELSKEEPIEYLQISINSYGGGVYNMYALYDVIESVKQYIPTIWTYACGKCMSSAVLLLASGTKGCRIASPYTAFMVHESWQEDLSGSVGVLDNEINHIKNIDDIWYRLMEQHSNLSSSKWKNLCRQTSDYYFFSQEAKKYGIIDNIGHIPVL